MVITNKKELEMAAEFLLKYANESANYKEFAAFGNVANVLKQAIKKGNFDDEHDAYILHVVKLPNMLEIAVEKCCTTDCERYRNGDCPYRDNKENCPVIKYLWLKEDEE